MPDELSKAIQRCFYFRALNPEQAAEIAKISRIENYQSGEMIFHEGEAAEAFYIVLQGQVQIYKISREGKEMILHLFGPGEIFAEVPVFSGIKTYPANVLCLRDTQVLAINGEGFLKLAHEHPELPINMLSLFAKRLREFNALIEDLALRSVDSRLAKYLLSLSENTPENATIKIHKKTLASILGTVPETLSRTLKKLGSEGIITVKGQEISILNRRALKRTADID